MNYTLQNHFLTKIGRFFTRTTASPSITQPINFYHLDNIHQFDIIKIAATDGVVINSNDLQVALELLQVIRSANQRMVYLKPIFITSLTLYEILKQQVDGWYQPSERQQLIKTATSINLRLKELESDATTRDTKSNVLRKVVQFLYTREKGSLHPYFSATSDINYAFPFISNLFPINKNSAVAQTLDIGVTEEWLEKKQVDTIKGNHKTIDINDYILTFAGEQLAKFGYYIAPKTIGLPEGILGLAPFQKLVQRELAHVQQNKHQSFLLELGLIQKNLSFLSTKAQEELALDCLLFLQKSGIQASFGFTPSHQLWLLLPELTEQSAIASAKKVFANLQNMLREILDISKPLVELNMFKVQEQLPLIQ